MTLIRTLTFSLLLFCLAYAQEDKKRGPELFNFANNLDISFMMDKSEITLDLCTCSIKNGGKGAGVKMRIAEPIGAQESTNTPWKIVTLDEKLKPISKSQGTSREKSSNKRFHHFIGFAPFAAANLISDNVCFESFSALAIPYLSEIIPSQNSDIIAEIVSLSRGPLSKSFYNNPIAMLLSLPDCAATTFNESMNSIFFNAGCAGVLGNNTSFGGGKASDPLMEHMVLAAEELDDLYFAGVMGKTSNATFATSPVQNIPNSMCGPKYFPIIVKTENYIQPMMPTPWTPQRIGMFRTFHADFKNKPGSGDDVASWLWRIKDFCLGAAKCKSLFPGGFGE